MAGSAEFLRVEVAGRGDSVGKRFDGPAKVVSMWAIGRVSLRVEARSFDEPLGEEVEESAKAAFMASWELKMQVGPHVWSGSSIRAAHEQPFYSNYFEASTISPTGACGA